MLDAGMAHARKMARIADRHEAELSLALDSQTNLQHAGLGQFAGADSLDMRLLL